MHMYIPVFDNRISEIGLHGPSYDPPKDVSVPSSETFELFVIKVGLYGHRGFVVTTLNAQNATNPTAHWFVAFDDWFSHGSFRVRLSQLTEAGLSVPPDFMESESLGRASAALADHLMTLPGIQGQYFRDEVETPECTVSELCQLWLRSQPSARRLQDVYNLSEDKALLALLNPVLDLEPIKARGG